ncbi:hypothetical protein Y032_0063g3451 [Ancylostoma ceylanicum]|uniref:Uncharacterized protein n=1 Tax=Ancylostoma ceylanicum TaxID=53326 RepID=A0A016U1I4_9BILA|nr:hypothetical protein Y032_0063g3451 [Ancylostoma ceylanicum]
MRSGETSHLQMSFRVFAMFLLVSTLFCGAAARNEYDEFLMIDERPQGMERVMNLRSRYKVIIPYPR